MEGGGDSRVSLYQSHLEREGTQTNIHYHVFDMIQSNSEMVFTCIRIRIIYMLNL